MEAKPMVTDVGICWAINADHMRDVYKKSPRIETFLGHMGQSSERDDDAAEIMNIPGVGDKFSFRLNLAMRGEE